MRRGTRQTTLRCSITSDSPWPARAENPRRPTSTKKRSDIKPEFPEALDNLGLLLLETGQPQRSLELLGKAVQLCPYYAEGFNNLGHALLTLNRRRTRSFSSSRPCGFGHSSPTRDRTWARPWSAPAGHRMRSGTLRRCYSQGPTISRPTTAWRRRCLAMNRADEAIQYLQQALKLKPDSVEVRANLAIAQAQTQHPKEAIETAEQASPAGPRPGADGAG